MSRQGPAVRAEADAASLERGLERTRREELRMVEDVDHVGIARDREEGRVIL